jgi:hypothetical protein
MCYRQVEETIELQAQMYHKILSKISAFHMEAVGNILLYSFRRLPRKPRLPKTSKNVLQTS